ncbi:MAG: ECF transporter S component [Candidatus Tectomicrobia bacterium]|nr:ECF transporter S component [Candidatus Tectomicrobia bacterium]
MSSNQPDQLFWATRWTLIDVVALVVTAVVLGIVFYLWGWAMQLLSRILGDVVAGLFYGVWFWAGLILAYAIRKPGAALLGEFGAALVAFVLGGALGGPLGALMLVSGWVQGLALEMVFAWAYFQHWGLVTMMVAGAVAGTASFAVRLAVDYGVGLAVDLAATRGVHLVAPPMLIFPQSAGIIIAILCIAVISGGVLGGLVCKILGDRLLAIAPVRQFLGTPVP